MPNFLLIRQYASHSFMTSSSRWKWMGSICNSWIKRVLLNMFRSDIGRFRIGIVNVSKVSIWYIWSFSRGVGKISASILNSTIFPRGCLKMSKISLQYATYLLIRVPSKIKEVLLYWYKILDDIPEQKPFARDVLILFGVEDGTRVFGEM